MSKRTMVIAACLATLFVVHGCRGEDPIQPIAEEGLSGATQPGSR